MINGLWVRFPAVHCRVSTWMCDRLYAGKSSRDVTGHIGQLSLPSIRGREIEYRLLAGVKSGCVQLCRVAGKTVWSHTESDISQLWDGVSLRALLFVSYLSSVRLFVRPSVMLWIVALKIGVRGWMLYHRVPSRRLSIHFFRHFCCRMYRYRSGHNTPKQDSWAIAKKTARCAQYMGALKSFESPHYAPGSFSTNL